jgi:hypothetical protein
MTKKPVHNKVKKFWRDNQEILENLYCRWQDEKEYEDIKDYGEVIRPKVEKIGGKFLKMLKRPFGYNFQLGGATYRIYVNSTTYGYKRLK